MCAKKRGLRIPKIFDAGMFLLDEWSVQDRRIARRLKWISARQVRCGDKGLGARHMMALWEQYCGQGRCHSMLSRLADRHPEITKIRFPATRVLNPHTGQTHLFILVREGDVWDWHCLPAEL